MEKAIRWFESRAGKVSYSMVRRNGPKSYDCSSAVFYALIEAGILPKNTFIGNTETMFSLLPQAGFEELTGEYIKAKRGDIFIWGKRGHTNGAAGHTGIFLDEHNIIHCNYGSNGITINNHDRLSTLNGVQHLTIFRYKGKNKAAPSLPYSHDPRDQVVEIGSFIRFDKIMNVVSTVARDGMWLAHVKELCNDEFSWIEHGVPCDGLLEVDVEGYRTGGWVSPQSKVMLPGKYQVLDIAWTGSRWFAKIEILGRQVWLDLEPATEIHGDDEGTIAKNRVLEVVAEKPSPKKQLESTQDIKDEQQVENNPQAIREAENWLKQELEKLNMERKAKMEDFAKNSLNQLQNSVETADFDDLKNDLSRKARLRGYIFGDLLLIAAATIAGFMVGETQAGILGGIAGALSAAGSGIIAMVKMTKGKK